MSWAQTFRTEEQEFVSQASEINDLQNLYLSLTSLEHDITRMAEGLVTLELK